MSRMLRVILALFVIGFLVRYFLRMIRQRPYDEQHPVRGRAQSKPPSHKQDEIQDATFQDIK